MKKVNRLLLTLCIASIAGVFLLQFFWISNYYYVNQAAFDKEVNSIFEDALKKEFMVRCDTIESQTARLLADTNSFSLNSRFDEKQHTVLLYITNKRDLKDRFYFHLDSVNKVVPENDHGKAKANIIKIVAHSIRINDLENHWTLYRTQALGNFLEKEQREYDFDTTRLRPIFTRLLNEKGIRVPFVFYLRSKDSTYNSSTFKPGLQNIYPVITKAFVTYKRDKNQHYIRAMFKNPFSYIITKMGLLFAGSIFLITIIAFSLFYLLKSLLTEKKLSLIKNDFISNITHELKTPIATVSAAVESLSDFDVLSDPGKTKRYLSHSKNELQRLSVLVDSILNSSLYDNQQFGYNPETFAVDEMMQGIIDSYKFDTPKRVDLIYHNECGRQFLFADKMLFQQAMSNVVDNAIKYSGDAVHISINCRLKGGFLMITIKDDGMGIAKENLPYLFEKFYRVPTNRHLVKGHGLGLSYVKSIMVRHKGRVKAESDYGKGTTIILDWPV